VAEVEGVVVGVGVRFLDAHGDGASDLDGTT
jgi:hypothetical protein